MGPALRTLESSNIEFGEYARILELALGDRAEALQVAVGMPSPANRGAILTVIGSRAIHPHLIRG